MMTPELDPASRMALVAQKLKEANALRATIPRSNGEIIGGHYVPPLADWSRSIFDRLDANAMDNEAVAELRKLSSDKNIAMSNFSKKYGDIDFNTDDGKKRLFQGLMEYMNTPALADSDVGKLFTTLLKPSSSLFGDITTVNDKLVHKGTGQVVAEVPPSADEVAKEQERTRRANVDDTRAQEEFNWRKSEAERKAELDAQEREYKHRMLEEQRQAKATKDADTKYNAFVAKTAKLIPAYEAARQLKSVLDQYKTGEHIPGFGLMDNVRALTGTLDEQANSNRQAFNRLREFYQLYATGAAAPDEQSKRIAAELGQQSKLWNNVEDVRSIFPDVAKWLDSQNTFYRGMLGTPEQASGQLVERGSPLADYLVTPVAPTTSIDPAMSPADKEALLKSGELQNAPPVANPEVLPKVRERKLPNGKTVIIEEH